MVDAVIKLFDSSAVTFDSNGLGYLTDCVNCTVVEERNGGFELGFNYPITGRHYNDILLRRIVVAKPNPYSTPQPFRIYHISRPIGGIVSISAQHISYDLSDVLCEPFTSVGLTNALSMLKRNMIFSTPFHFSTDITNVKTEMTIEQPKTARAILGGTDGSILDLFGGEYEFDGFSVYLHKSRGNNNGVSIRYGKNLTNLTYDEKSESVYTGVYPYYISSDDSSTTFVTLSNPIISLGNYSFKRIYPLDLSSEFDGVPTEDQLRDKANEYIKVNKRKLTTPTTSLNISFVQLAMSEEYERYKLLEDVRLCDSVTIEYPELNVSAVAKCIKTEYNVLTDKYVSLELGDVSSNLASTISDLQSGANTDTVTKQQAATTAKSTVSKALGLSGGSIVIRDTNSDTFPDELLILDSANMSSAVNVWRFDSSGFSHSANGVNGDYTMAILQNGGATASFITMGILKSLASNYDSETGLSTDGIAFDISNGIFSSKYFRILSDGSVELDDNAVSNVMANYVKSYDSAGNLIFSITNDDGTLAINSTSEIDISSNGVSKIVYDPVEDEVVHTTDSRFLRHTEDDPYYTKEINFTSTGFTMKIGVPSTTELDFVNTFTISRNSDDEITSIRNDDTGFTLTVTR